MVTAGDQHESVIQPLFEINPQQPQITDFLGGGEDDDDGWELEQEGNGPPDGCSSFRRRSSIIMACSDSSSWRALPNAFRLKLMIRELIFSMSEMIASMNASYCCVKAETSHSVNS